MNDCKSIQPQLSEYVDGELSEADAWKVKLHLSSCAVCSSIADDFGATARLVSSLPEPIGPSAGFEAALARRIADQMLAPKPLTIWDRARLWWENQSDGYGAAKRRPFVPALAAAAAMAAVIPAAIVLTRPPVAPPTIHGATPPNAAQIVTDDPALSELWQEHAAFSSAQSLGDPATLTGDETGDR